MALRWFAGGDPFDMDCKTIAVTTCGDSFIIFVEEVKQGKEEGPTKYDRVRDQCEMIVL